VVPSAFAKNKRTQWVPLDPLLREALLALPRHGKKVFHFVSRRSLERLHLDAMSDRVVRLAKKASVRLTMHALRKGFGCRYAGKVPAQVLQKLMRHRNIKTTMDYDANVDDAVMEAVLGAAKGQLNSLPNTLPQAAKEEKSADATKGSQGRSSDLS
jgi:integrase